MYSQPILMWYLKNTIFPNHLMKLISNDMVGILKILDYGAHESYGSMYQSNRTYIQIYPMQPI